MSGYRVTTGAARDSRYPLYHDYLWHYDRVASLYDYSPHLTASLPARARELRDFDGDRVGLAAGLQEYNRSLGAPPETLSSCRRLARPGSVVVIGGQQPGVLTGPLYTFWKAVAVVQLAEALARRLPPDTPVVPVFWIGAEDHDRDEVAPVNVPVPDGPAVRIIYDSSEGRPAGAAFPARTSVGYLPAGQAAEAFLARLEPALWRTEFTAQVMDLLRRTAAASGNLGDWFGRLLLSLVGGRGLVVANPLHPGLRALESPILRRMIQSNEAASARFTAGREKVRELGYEPQVEKDPDAANLYLYRGFERVPLRRLPAESGVRFLAGAGSEAERLTETELLDIAARNPERLSTNVVFRPLAQDAVFPVLAYVGGPGETSYYGLYRDLYHLFGRRLPIVYPRPGVTIVEQVEARRLDRTGLTAEQALDLDVLRRAKAGYLAEADPIGIDEVFDRLENSVRQAYSAVSGAVTSVDPSLADLASKNLARVKGEIEWLKNKTRQRHRQNCREAVHRYEAIEAAFRPQGDYQERVWNIFSYLAKYGLDLALSLTALPLVPADGLVDPNHRFVWL
jgi:bacillithiol biosynthesis cysteine-adding enzyme BshC